MLTQAQNEQDHRLRRAVDHLTAVEQALDMYHINPSKHTWKAVYKLLADGNKYPSSLGLIGSKVICKAMREGVVALKEAHADARLKLHTANK